MATHREILYVLTEAEVTLQRIAAEIEDTDGSLFEAKRLLRDIAFVLDLLPQAESFLMQLLAFISDWKTKRLRTTSKVYARPPLYHHF